MPRFKNANRIVISVVFLLSVVTAVILVTSSRGNAPTINTSSSNNTPEKVTNDQTVTPQQAAPAVPTTEAAPVPQTTKTGNYVTLATYNSNKQSYANTKRVYFFHAPWCSICATIDKEIMSNPGGIPSGVTLIKTDFDSNSELRKKYGVTSQYTFVQIDDSEAQVAKWSATSFEKVLAGIK